MLNSLSLNFRLKALLLVSLWSLLVGSVFAQTTAFTYQGRLTDSGSPANGSYDLQFKLFDLLSGGSQQGATQTLSSVTVTTGIFTVQLDFGTGVFTSNQGKFLEIGVRNAGVGGFTTLPQRQPVTSTPYAIQSLSATSATSFTGNLSGDVTGTQAATAVSTVGGATAANVASGANAANAATNANTPNTIVKRDGSGNFSAGTITAALNGNASTATTAGNVTGTVALANGGTGAITAANARTNLGLGSLATVTPTGTANNTTFLRGDNTWADPTGGTVVWFGTSIINPANATPWYSSISGGSTFTSNGPEWTGIAMPAACTFDTLKVTGRYVGGTGSDDITITLTQNSSNTGMQCTLSGMNTVNTTYTCSSSTTVAVAAGDIVGLHFTQTNGTSTGPIIRVGVGVKCQ